MFLGFFKKTRKNLRVSSPKLKTSPVRVPENSVLDLGAPRADLGAVGEDLGAPGVDLSALAWSRDVFRFSRRFLHVFF